MTVELLLHITLITNVNTILTDNQLKKLDRSFLFNFVRTIIQIMINVIIINTIAGVQRITSMLIFLYYKQKFDFLLLNINMLYNRLSYELLLLLYKNL